MTIKEMLTFVYKSGQNDYQVAERVGVNASTIFRLRKGETLKTDYETFQAVQKIYNAAKRKMYREVK